MSRSVSFSNAIKNIAQLKILAAEQDGWQILQTTFSNPFLWEAIIDFDPISLKFVCSGQQRFNLQEADIG